MRDWKRVNNNLVKRGSIFVDLSFLDRWGGELKDTNKAKGNKRVLNSTIQTAFSI